MNLYYLAMICWFIILLVGIYDEIKRPSNEEESQYLGFGVWLSMVAFIFILMLNYVESNTP